jgi:tetratricopeptide (TPR) repeat protein
MAHEAKKSINSLIDEDRFDEAERRANKELAAFRGQGNAEGSAIMLLALADLAMARVQAAQALKAAREAWPLAKSTGQKQLQAEVLMAMINGLNMQGSAKEALRAASTSKDIITDANDPALEAGLHHAMAIAHLKLEDAEYALEAEEKALAIYKRLKDKSGEAKSLTTTAKAQQISGQFDQAIATAKEAAALWRSMGKAAGIVACLETVMNAQAAQGYPKAALAVAEEELSLLQKSGVNTKNELLMIEKVVQVASDQGQYSEALRTIEDMIKVCRNANDKLGEAQKTRQAAEMHMDLNHSQDALRVAKEAEDLFQSLGMAADVEDMRKLQSSIFVKKGQHSKAPHRSEALLALKQFVRAVEQREVDQVKLFEVELDKASSAIKDMEMSNTLESLFERDPSAVKFLEEHGWDLTSFKVPTKIYQYPHQGFYLTTIAGGMNFGPQFRGVHPYRKGKPSDDDARAMSVVSLPEAESWQGQLLFRPGIMDAGIQACSTFNFPPQ